MAWQRQTVVIEIERRARAAAEREWGIGGADAVEVFLRYLKKNDVKLVWNSHATD